jgi:hypothetical protein
MARQLTAVPAIGSAIVASLLAAGCAGTATSPTAAPAAVVAGKPVPGEIYTAGDGRQVRCIVEPVTGSRVPQRTCRTLDEWKALEEAGQQYGRDMQGPLVKAPGD